MKKLHLALATHDIAATVADYTRRLECAPEVVVAGEYALWRTPNLNLSVRNDPQCAPGQLRHLGWEDDAAERLSSEQDVNGILWEHFSAAQQAEEIEQAWPGSSCKPA
jgi:hypothetical protein